MKKLFCIMALVTGLLVASFATVSPPPAGRSVSPTVCAVAPATNRGSWSASTIYTLKQKRVSEVALVHVFNIAPKIPIIGGSLDWDAFAGVQDRGEAVGGVGAVYSREISKRLMAQLGLVACIQKERPVDAGLLVGLALKF